MTPKHPNKGPFVRDLKPGDRIIGFYLAQHRQLEPFRDRTRGHFLTLVLSDRSGQIIARVWEGAPELAEQFQAGDVLKVAGDVEAYQDRVQLIVNRLRPAQPDEYDLADFLPATEKIPQALLADALDYVGRIQNPHLRALVTRFYDDPDFQSRLMRAPAARRVHHAYLGGLLEHLIEVLKLCEAIIALYPELSADLLYAGALLHDLGKLREYTWEGEIDYTDEGRLVGHIVINAEVVSRAIAELPEFPEDLRLRVLHMLVSHHGRYEWGSPRRPQTLEAIALHHAYDLSAQINRFSRLLALRRDPGQPWTEYDRLLGRQLYAGQSDDLNIEEASQLE